ncbi:MAG: heterodisulfide reductase-related iron-sulfur binding cluster [Rubrivivax sp.]|nr:heterodisulfide reductase-related iron-sulfur binding cluster [Rubrivivax sp.]
MSPLGISLLMLAAFAGFGWGVWRKGAIVLALQPAVRWDAPLQRLKSVFLNGLLQQRMVKREWKPGLMHAVIFLGFVSLLLRKLQLIAIGYSESVAFAPWFGGPFAAFKDFVEVAVTLAVLYGFWRRFVLKPARLEPNREAVVVLSLILAIMLTDFAFDGFRFALLAERYPDIAHERDWAFIGGAVAASLQGQPDTVLRAGYVFCYWTQLVVVFSFLVLLPLGEHFHIVTALPALFFRRGRPAHRVPTVDIEKLMEATEEADMKAGVATARDLQWIDAFDVFTCTECGRCKDACPTHLTGKPLSMKSVNDSLKHHLVAQREALVGDGKAELPLLLGPVISDDTLWACTSCGYCEAACPIELEHLDRFFRMRQHQVMIAGEFPHELKKVFEAYESQGNPWGLDAGQRGDWAQGLGVKQVRSAEDMAGLDVLFYVGSAMSFDPRGQKIARAFVTILQRAGVRFGMLGADEGSTGECVRRTGNEMLFQQLAGSLIGTLNQRGVQRIVTCDPHALNSLRNEYPEFGGHYEVVHHTQFIQELLAQGRIAVNASLQRVVFHDPCYLGRHNGEFEAPRVVLAQLCSDTPLEMALSREKAMCCGAGGGRMWMEETIGKRINILRVEQALEVRPQTIATACPYCAVMVGDGLGAVPGAAALSRDIAELVAEALVPA